MSSKTDITQAQELVEQTKDLLWSIVQEMPVMVFAADASGNIYFWNEQCEEVTGFKADEVLENSPELKSAGIEKLRRRISKSSVLTRSQWKLNFACKDGKNKTLRWSSMVLPMYEKTGIFWAVGSDIIPISLKKCAP